MPEKSYTLSKSRYIQGLQCHKSLWLYTHKRELLDEEDAGTTARFSDGHRVGELAQNLYPGGVIVPYDGLTKSSFNYLEPYFATARGILAGNPEMHLAQWRDKVRIVSRNLQMTAPHRADGVTDKVYEALLRERRICVRYRLRDDGGIKEYAELNPLGLVFVDNLIYLVASIGEYATPLQFLLHRMETVTLLVSAVTVPTDFTLQGYIESGEFSYPAGKETIRLKALFDRDAAAYLYETPLPGMISLVDVDEDEVLLEAEVLDSRQLRWWLRGFGDQVEVLEPAELRAEFKEMAKVLKSVYRYGIAIK